MILDYVSNYEVNNTLDALRDAAEKAWWILGEWGFDEDEKITVLGFQLRESFPDGSLQEQHPYHISLVLEINNLLWNHQVDCSIIVRPLGIEPCYGGHLKGEMLAWDIDSMGLIAVLEFLQWLYEGREWPWILCTDIF